MVRDIGEIDTQLALEEFCRLDRPHRRGRTAQDQAARGRRASSATSSSRCGTGATPRPICTTRSRPTSAIPPSMPGARSTARPRIHRQPADPRSEDQHGDLSQDDAARPEHAAGRSRVGRVPVAPSPYWGDEMIWNSQTSVAQSDDRSERTRVVHGAHPRAADAGVLPQGLGPSVGEAVPDRQVRPASGGVRSQDREAHATSIICFTTHHLVFAEDADNTLVVLAGGARAPYRLAQHARNSWRPATRRRRRAGRRSSSTPTATASATKAMSSPTSRSIPPRTSASTPGSTASATIRTTAPSGVGAGFPGGVVHVIPGDNPPATTMSEYYEVPFNEPRAPVNGFVRAASISTATAWSGCRLRAVTWRASTARSARVRSTVRPRDRQALPGGLDALSVPGPAVRGPERAGRGAVELLHLGRPVGHPRARQERADSPPATCRIRWKRWSTASSSRCACPIRWASTPRAWTAGSTTPNTGWKGRGIWSTYAPLKKANAVSWASNTISWASRR